MKSANRTAKIPSKKLRSVRDNFEDEYNILEKLEGGGTGVVFKAHRAGDPDTLVAIKFYLPPTQNSLFQETTLKSLLLPMDEHVFEAEFNFLKRTRHPSIQEIVSYGTLLDAAKYLGAEGMVPSDGSVRFLITKYIDGMSLLRWIDELGQAVKDRNTDRFEARRLLVRCILDIAEALVFIHEVRHYQHSDLRSANILVHHHSSRPIVIDFAYAHCFDLEALGAHSRMTHIRYFPDNCPEALQRDLRGLVKKCGANRVPREELKALVFPGLDLYHLGLLLRDVIEAEATKGILSAFDIEFIELISKRLKNWQSVKTASTSQYRDQLAKLSEGYWSLGESVDSYPSTQPVKRIALPGASLWITPAVEKILETHAFRRLQLLKQLSLIHLVYPGATQTRFEHSLSVYVTAGELVQSLIKSPRFCVLFDNNSVRQLMLVSLLHDINHFPFLHYFQEMKLETLAAEFDLIDLFCSGVDTKDKIPLYKLMADSSLEPKTFKDILFRDHAELRDPTLQVIKSVIDSAADIDKLTYVIEDARYTGVPFGAGVDRRTLLHYADIGRFKEKKDNYGEATRQRYHLCFRREAISAVESLLLARYWNFKRIYWHHTNRAIGAMISHVIYRLFVEKGASFEEYIKATMGMDESGALHYLNDRYHNFFKEQSIISGLASHRDELFKRLYSLKVHLEEGGAGTASDANLFHEIERLDVRERFEFVRYVSEGFERLFKPYLGSIAISPQDVLLDVPGRPLDEAMGLLYICDLALDGTPERTFDSAFIRQLRQQFNNLSRTIRFFIAPHVRAQLGKERIEAARGEIEEEIRQALAVIKRDKVNQIR